MEDFDDVIQEFLVESYENLDQLDRDLVALEREPTARDKLASIFRTIHTIKGTSGFLAFNKLEQVTHVGESLLARLRDGTQQLDPDTTDVLLGMIDVVRALLSHVELDKTEGPVEIQACVDTVNDCIAGRRPSQLATAAASGAEPAAPPVAQPVAQSGAEPGAESTGRSATESASETVAQLVAHAVAHAGGPVSRTVTKTVTESVTESVSGAVPGAQAGEPGTTTVLEAAEPAPESAGPPPVMVPSPRAAEPEAVDPDAEPLTKRSVSDTAIRVDVALLDTLMRLVGELVLTRNQLVRAAESANEQALGRTAQRLNIITSELQEGVMRTRMQPINNLWSKLPRVVRDLSKACGREVRLVMEGADTELDRSLLEAVKDPLTHLVRNAVDHGIELPEVRIAAGKPAEGVLTLRAYHEHGHVIVDVADDGGGIDPAVIGRIAVAKGVVTQLQLDAMDTDEVLRLVFQAGFSTAAKVSNVSGRGVGMDVVRTNLEAIGGTVDLRSELGEGTTWRLTIPLTLAIVQALIVESAGHRYVLPQMAVHELVYLGGQDSNVVEYISGAPVYRLRGKLLPLIRLATALGGPPIEGELDSEVYLAVLKADGHQFGLVVDRVLNTEEVVVKPLAARLKDVGCYAGATILGDGRVALILDVQSLARRSHLGSLERAARSVAGGERVAVTAPKERLLITKVADRTVAIPLSMVTRLEEFPVSSIERVGTREVVQYRERILPLVRLGQLLGAWSESDRETVSTIVYTEGGHSVALAVDTILDIVDDDAVHSALDDDGLDGSAVIHDRVTELLDVRRAILAADPGFFTRDAIDSESHGSQYVGV